MSEIRARVISQEKGLYTICYEGKENKAEVSGKFRYEAGTVSDFPTVGDYVVASWPEDGSHSIISGLFPRKSIFVRKAAGTDNKETFRDVAFVTTMCTLSCDKVHVVVTNATSLTQSVREFLNHRK